MCALIRPPVICAQCNCKRYLWCIHNGGCAFCLVPLIVPSQVGSLATQISGFTIVPMESLLCTPLLQMTIPK